MTGMQTVAVGDSVVAAVADSMAFVVAAGRRRRILLGTAAVAAEDRHFDRPPGFPPQPPGYPGYPPQPPADETRKGEDHS